MIEIGMKVKVNGELDESVSGIEGVVMEWTDIEELGCRVYKVRVPRASLFKNLARTEGSCVFLLGSEFEVVEEEGLEPGTKVRVVGKLGKPVEGVVIEQADVKVLGGGKAYRVRVPSVGSSKNLAGGRSKSVILLESEIEVV